MNKILVTTGRSILLVDIKNDKKKVIHRKNNAYYGISKTDEYIYVATRRSRYDKSPQSPSQNSVLIFDFDLKLLSEISPPFPLIDVHEIKIDEDCLYVTNTEYNSISIYKDKKWEDWAPFKFLDENIKDDYHFNSLYLEKERIYVLAHNRGNSEVYCFCKKSKTFIFKFNLGRFSHNLWKENGVFYTCSSGEQKIISELGFDFTVCSNKFFPRGYSHLGNTRLVGLSQMKDKESRSSVGYPAFINCYNNDWNLQKQIRLPCEGQLHDICLL